MSGYDDSNNVINNSTVNKECQTWLVIQNGWVMHSRWDYGMMVHLSRHVQLGRANVHYCCHCMTGKKFSEARCTNKTEDSGHR